MNNCPNCGSSLNQGEAFCRVCGTKLSSPQNNFSSSTQQVQPMNAQNTNYQQQNINPVMQEFQHTQNNIINEDDLIDYYIGPNVDKIKKGDLSINTFFCGFLYVLYRKMWLLGFMWLAISLISNIFLPSIASIINLVVNIIISTQFKKLYLKHAKEQVRKIREENPGKTYEQLVVICSKKGGVTLIPDFITIILYLIIFNSVLLFTNQKDVDHTQDVSNSLGTIENLEVSVPSNLVESSYSSDNYKSYRTSIDGKDSCSLTLKAIKGSNYNNDAKQYLEKDIYYAPTDTYSGVTSKTLNNNVWYYANVISSYNQEYYYSIINNGIIYEVEFSIASDENKTCSSAHNTIINSLKFN